MNKIHYKAVLPVEGRKATKREKMLGTPTTVAYAGTLSINTDFAPILDPCPTTTGPSMLAPAPMRTPSPI